MSAISIKPIIATPFTVSKSRKLQKKSEFFAKRLDFCRDFSCRRSVTWAIRREKEKSMKGSNWVRATTSDEGVQAFEQDALVDGSLTFGAGGIEATLNNLSKWLVSALFAAIILARHDPEALWAATGAVLNSALSVALKKILNQERPFSTLRSDPGMPSSHAQSIFYTITFLNLSMVEWSGINAFTTILSGFFFIGGSYFSWLRVSQQLHTASQVVVGAVLGSIFSIFWFWSWYNLVLSLYLSSLWVRIMVVLGAVGLCLGFLYHVYRTWIVEER